jgi:hypothetical protein
VLDVSTTGSSASSSRIVKAANLVELHDDGYATLADGTRLPGVDTVMYCTGYDYSFPFLQQGEASASSGGNSSDCSGSGGGGFVSVQDNRVGPLYQHIFPPAAVPTLSFVGLPWKVVPFPQFELQARWIARVLAGTAQLPPREVSFQGSVGSGDASTVAQWWRKLAAATSLQPSRAAPAWLPAPPRPAWPVLQEMEAHTAAFYAELEAAGIAVRYTHRQSGAVQWQYNAWLQQQCGEAPGPAWRKALYAAGGMSRKLNAERYRDMPLPGAEAAEQAAREDAARVRQRRADTAAAARGYCSSCGGGSSVAVFHFFFPHPVHPVTPVACTARKSFMLHYN